MKCGVLFSGGKDSTYAALLTKKYFNDISCLISIISENPESYMFHTPSIKKVKKQSEVMNIPLLVQETKGQKEEELRDLEFMIQKAKTKYKIEAVVTGSIDSAYQASRVQKICDNLELECFNPLVDILGTLKNIVILNRLKEAFDKGIPSDGSSIAGLEIMQNKAGD